LGVEKPKDGLRCKEVPFCDGQASRTDSEKKARGSDGVRLGVVPEGLQKGRPVCRKQRKNRSTELLFSGPAHTKCPRVSRPWLVSGEKKKKILCVIEKSTSTRHGAGALRESKERGAPHWGEGDAWGGGGGGKKKKT